MFSSGLVVCLGLVMWFIKCNWRWRMRLLSYPLAVDLIVFAFLTVIHWGTFSGVMAATAGALLTSILLSIGRYFFGYIEDGKYHRGIISVLPNIIAERTQRA